MAGTTRPPQVDPLCGQLIGNYLIQGRVGQGGMGIVYAAVHRHIGRLAAIKVLDHRLSHDREYAARFLNEARAVNIIRHPGLIEIFEFGQLPDGRLYIIMELLEGQTLGQRLRAGPLSLPEALEIGSQIAQALCAAHDKHIIHRDLKPDNVMLVLDPERPQRPRVKLLDFGVAKVGLQGTPAEATDQTVQTQTGISLGTPRYMAPEQFGSAAEVTDRADVFSLGVMLYELLGEKAPFARGGLDALVKAARPLREINPAVPPALALLIQRTLDRVPHLRPAMPEVAAGLRPAPVRWLARNRWLVAGTLAAALLAPALWWRLRPAPPAVIEAQGRARARAVLQQGLSDRDGEVRASACRAAGKSLDPALAEPLQRLLQDPETMVRAEAAAALGQLGAIPALPALRQAAQRPDRPRVMASGALLRLGDPAGAVALKQALAEDDPEIRLRAALLLAEAGEAAGQEAAAGWLRRDDLPEEARLRILAHLARGGAVRARAPLLALRERAGQTLMGLTVLDSLARLGEPGAREDLQQAARGPGPRQLLAARLLAGLGDFSGCTAFDGALRGETTPPALRLLALEGAAECGSRDVVPLLSGWIDRPPDPALRLPAAAALLRLTGRQPGQVAEESLRWARVALLDERWDVRQAAVTVLGEVGGGPALALLGQALADRRPEVRRTAAEALGRRPERAAVPVLGRALGDADETVRRGAMRALAAAVETLAPAERGALAADLGARLRELAGQGAAQDRLVASGTLLRLGDESQRDPLRGGLSAADPALRRLAVEMCGPDEDRLAQALQDADPAVRLAAARKLAGRRVPQALLLLRQVLAQGGIEGLLAYESLKRAGEEVAAPPGLVRLFAGADLATRAAVLGAVPDLPDAEALALLRQAILDRAAVIRRQAADLLSGLAQAAEARALLQVLAGDADLAVRARAAALLSRLPEAPEEKAAAAGAAAPGAAPAAPAPERSPSVPPAPPPGPAEGPGYLLATGEERVRFQVDRGAAHLISEQPLALPPGRHRVTYPGGGQDIELRAGQTVTLHIPATLAGQLLGDAAEALDRRDLSRAQRSLDQARALGRRLPRESLPRLLYQRGRLFEAQGRWVEAMTEYDRVLKLEDPAQRRAAQEALQRLAPRMGRLMVSKQDPEGRCMTVEQWLPPGEHMVDLGGGRSQVVRVRAGGTAQVRSCR